MLVCTHIVAVRVCVCVTRKHGFVYEQDPMFFLAFWDRCAGCTRRGGGGGGVSD